jgi:hypothetical protein
VFPSQSAGAEARAVRKTLAHATVTHTQRESPSPHSTPAGGQETQLGASSLLDCVAVACVSCVCALPSGFIT